MMPRPLLSTYTAIATSGISAWNSAPIIHADASPAMTRRLHDTPRAWIQGPSAAVIVRTQRSQDGEAREPCSCQAGRLHRARGDDARQHVDDDRENEEHRAQANERGEGEAGCLGVVVHDDRRHCVAGPE